MGSTNSINPLNSECNNCKMKLEQDTGLVECLMEVIRCQWINPFGDKRYCEHPEAKQFVNLVNSDLSKFDERKVKRV